MEFERDLNSNHVTLTFADKTNHQNEFGLHFYLVKVMENDISKIPKSHIIESISCNVLLLPYWKQNIPH